MRTLMMVVLIGLGAYGAFVGMLYLTQGQMVFLPMSAHSASPSDAGLPYEEVWLDTEDGERLHAWFIPAREGAEGQAGAQSNECRAPVLLFLHGNAGNISHRLESLDIFHRIGLSVLILDYRGYGKSSGSPTEEGTYRDALAGWHHLVEERDYAPEEVVIFGRSLGAAVAAYTGAQVQPGALILESAFTSAPDLGAELYPWVPVRTLLRFEYDTRRALEQVESPILLAHSRDDEIVPHSHLERLKQAAGQAREVSVLEMRGGHNDGFMRSGEDYVRGLGGFLEKSFDCL
ncbi:alpha/beta hydrolase [Ectothiorhodospira sp. BSL-9]|uniref:alpha/beta hydrolase n=1 Tax=Ectothiorhodospira sp. BSL-9 TaxID=1442136 RepID=UPI0007B456D1|nr:alpha/beta hydrolase [Ectothiorhodospira sp. BSL-9]ANB03536.1 lysophospholipase [Ectothiorhodospira sp. BSL-9]TVQ68546.1 MAG: alpha/beta hydrolase [Chromatiaceae bacterium]